MSDLSIILRKVEFADMSEVIELLQQISKFKVPEFNKRDIWKNFSNQSNVYSLVALVEKKIVGYGSLVIEKKIRGGKMGHIEDIVSHKNYKKKDIGKTIVNGLFEIAKKKGCYKVSLQCTEHNVSFYEKCNYLKSGVAMQRLIHLKK